MAAARARWRPSRTLRGRLTVGLAVILLAACAVLGAATALFLRSFLLGQLDSQLAAAGGRFSVSLERGELAPGGDDGDADNAVPGQSVGTIGIRLLGGQVAQAAEVSDDGSNRTLTFTAADTALLAALAPGRQASSADLSIGDYRLQAVAGHDGDVQITGLPLHPVNGTLARLAIIEAALFGILVLAGGTATAIVVRRTLQPLERVSATALRVSELPLTDADTVLPAGLGPAEPTSEVDQVSVAFDHMLEHVRSALAVRDATEDRLRRFVADASHELRTPLATIRAHAEYAGIADGPPSAPVAEALSRITSATDRMGTLVADLLLLARLDAGRPLAREPVDLTRLVLDAVFDARAAGPEHHWRLDLPEEAVAVTGDGERLHQVLANLLTNARTHTPAGTTVTTTLSPGPAAVEVAVRDDGPGIAAALQAELFDRFTRGDSSRARDHGSTGLGLAIAYGIATVHDGTLTVTSTPGEGTAFLLRLPAG
ncbi:MAG TPA: HAMP domain-containing sensor histidine kinase [Mycobacteriales bacterium]|nr:HAMP domain-containing sensor histidine kinase [Mycobacteriales bacterium]